MRFAIFYTCFIFTFANFDVENLRSKNVEIRVQAITTLGTTQGEENFAILLNHFPKMNTVEKRAYMQVLGKWQGKERTKASQLLVGSLLAKKESRQVKIIAATALGGMVRDDKSLEDKQAKKRVKNAIKALKKALLSTRNSYQVRESIIRSFGIIGDLQYIKFVMIGLKDKYKGVRVETAKAFEVLGASEHVDILIKHYLRERQVMVHKDLIEIIYRLDKIKALPLLQKVLKNRRNDNYIRDRSSQMLGQYSGEEYVDSHKKIVEILARSFSNEKDRSLKTSIIKSLANFDISSPKIQKVYQMAKKDRKSIRHLAEELLGK